MPESKLNNTDLTAAVKFLKIFSCTEPTPNLEKSEAQQLRTTLLLVTQEAEWENIGICADNLTQALTALQSYLQALGYKHNLYQQVEKQTEIKQTEPVYIKFNTQKLSLYADTYTGNSRGVLVATQGAEEAALGTFGYFPLDLFA